MKNPKRLICVLAHKTHALSLDNATGSETSGIQLVLGLPSEKGM